MVGRRKKSDIKTTGHEWDGIQENDLEDPYYMRVLFYITLIFSLCYWIIYPSWPSPNNRGISNWSSIEELQEDLAKVQAVRNVYQAEFDKSTWQEILEDEDLLKFALRGGEIAFNNNCAPCHQVGGGGAVGYPNLTTGAWLWGGDMDAIYTTLLYGIRSGHEEARDSIMAAFGKEGILNNTQIERLADYVLGLRLLPENADEQSLQQDPIYDLFQEQCSSCHGVNGEGGREFGAPSLRDAVWLYGGSRDKIIETLYNGRAGVMPYWQGKLTDSTIRQLVVYVHQLGGGEDLPKSTEEAG